MPKYGDPVVFNAGGTEQTQFAFVTRDNGDNNVDLIAASATGAWEHHTSVPKRDVSDYGPEGGGDTWHDA